MPLARLLDVDSRKPASQPPPAFDVTIDCAAATELLFPDTAPGETAAVILEPVRQRPQAPIGDPNAAKPASKPRMADGGRLPLKEAEHRRPPDLRVEERQQLVHLAGDRMPHHDVSSRRFELASGGTIFPDGIDNVPLQAGA